MSLAFWKKDSQDLELVFEDDFHRLDSNQVGPGWLDKGQDTKLEGKSLRIRGGWLSGAADVPGNVRLEFDVRTHSPARINFGAFINGAEGFWNGYDFSTNSDGNTVMRRSHISVASRSGLPVKTDKTQKMYLQRLGNRVTLGLDGKTMLEFLDLEPFAETGVGKFGFWAYSTDAQINRVRVYRIRTTEKLSPLSVGDRLFAKGMLGQALDQYRNAMPVLNEDEKELCALKVGLTLIRTGQPKKALEWLDETARKDLSGAGRSRLNLLQFEASIPGQSRNHFQTVLKEIFSDKGSVAERQGLLSLLGRLDGLWEQKGLWMGNQVKEDLALLLSKTDVLGYQGAVRNLLKFGQILGGREGFELALEGLAAESSVLTATARRELEKQRAELHYFHSRDGHEGAEAWRKEKNATTLGNLSTTWESGQSTVALDDAWGEKGDRLLQWFEDTLKVKNGLNEAMIYIPVADYVWGRGEEQTASGLYRDILRVFPNHGLASCASWLALSAMAAWSGQVQEGGDMARKLLGDYPAENWCFSVARYASGAYGREGFLADPQRVEYWASYPPKLLPLVTVAARAKGQGESAFASEILEMIRGTAFPWEPAWKVADRWLKELRS